MSQPYGQLESTGAVFFITNEPDGNFVVSADIGSDGKLILRQAVSTFGVGAHGITDPVGPDPLFSQGSVKTSPVSNILVTVNAGSNTLSIFSINPSDPAALTMIGKPVSSEGEFPMSLAINANGTQVCALNGGAINGVSCYKVDQKQGLVAQANTVRSLGLNQTTPATGPAGSASHIIFSENGQSLIVSVKGIPPQPGFLAVWDVAQDGSLSKDFQSITPGKGGLLPFSLTVIPGQNAIFATDAGIGFDIFDFSSPSAGGNKSSVVPIDGQGATCWSSFSHKTGNFYLTDIETSIVTEVNVDVDLKGTIVQQYPQGKMTGTIDIDIVTVGSNDFLFVLAANATSIDVLLLDAPGKAQNIQTLAMGAEAKAAGLELTANNIQGMTSFIVQQK